jgi:hypothetical protein
VSRYAVLIPTWDADEYAEDLEVAEATWRRWALRDGHVPAPVPNIGVKVMRGIDPAHMPALRIVGEILEPER